MGVDKKTLVGTVDLTPTWEQQVRNCLEIINTSTNVEAVTVATNELIRMGKIIDQHIHNARASDVT